MTKSYPLVTVYLVNHNYGRFLKRSIDSVLSQDFLDFELIIIDDGSTDHSNEILINYEQIDKVNVVRQKNKGLSVTNNIALKMSSSSYIMRLDADDYLLKNALSVLTSRMEADPDLALVFPDYYEVDEYGEILHRVKRHDFEKDVTLYDIPAHGACTMFRRDVLRDVGGYDENITRQDGYDIWLKIAHRYKVANINEPLFYYRKHPKSLTQDESALLNTQAKILKKHVNIRKVVDLKILSVIPVRGSTMDSRSRPLEVLGNKPLVNWTIDEALECEDTNQIILTTPDKNLINYVNSQYGEKVSCHKRNSQLSRINQSLSHTIQDVLDSYKSQDIDALLILNIEAPFRNAMYISKAVHIMQLYDVDVVIGVRMDDDMFYIHEGNGLKPRRGEDGMRLERDDLYRKVGGMTLVKKDFFNEKNKIIGGQIGHAVMDQRSAFLIKSELDWEIAGMILNQKIV